MEKKLVLATHNPNKVREIGEILPDWEISGEDSGAEETAETFAGNAALKARAVAAHHPGVWVLADDSGLEVFALGGAPGVRSARYAGEDGNTPKNNALLLKNMVDVADRRAQFTCAMVLIGPDGAEHTAVGHCPGTILREQHGAGGFGYDPLFVPDGYTKTFAELKPEEKNAISHRGRALAEINKILAECAVRAVPRVAHFGEMRPREEAPAHFGEMRPRAEELAHFGEMRQQEK